MAKKFSGFTDDQALILLNKVGFPGQSMQADEVSAFLAANPNAQAKLGQYAAAAQKRLDMLTTPTTGYAVGGLAGSIVNSGALPTGGVAKEPAQASQQIQDQQVQAANMNGALMPDYMREQDVIGGTSDPNSRAAQRQITPEIQTARQGVVDNQAILSKLQQDYAAIDPANTAAQATAKAAIDAQSAKVAGAQAGLNTAQTNYQTLNMPSLRESQTAALADPLSMTTTAAVDQIQATPDQVSS